ncbi:hypothetical protein ESCO_005168 [Escovopsis weberi]|uniref:Uncharacterized protein n=1 Tax=Escovopsis weberi TaxID=150374 RepID=A0A0M8MYT2_ESCWE|nr:hypothetical protein ESCO_005168 [Escovopsis weberi]
MKVTNAVLLCAALLADSTSAAARWARDIHAHHQNAPVNADIDPGGIACINLGTTTGFTISIRTGFTISIRTGFTISTRTGFTIGITVGTSTIINANRSSAHSFRCYSSFIVR